MAPHDARCVDAQGGERVQVLYCAAPDDGDPAFGFELVEDDASQDGYVGVVSARGRELLEELAAALDGQSATAAAGGCGGASDLEAFYAHWYGAGVPGRRSGVRCPGWEWMQRLGAMCDEVCSGFDELLRDLESLERQRREVAAKTVALHEQCDARIKEQRRLDAFAGAISQRVEVFDAGARLAQKLEEDSALASPTAFAAALDDIEASVAYLEAHYDFGDAKAGFQHFEHLRAQALILARASLQRSLKRAEADVERYLWEVADEGVDTEVFYAPFHAVAAAHRPFMGVLLRRFHVHRQYASVLEELEAAFCALRLRIVGDAASEHLMVLRGTLPEPRQLPRLLREASSYLLEAARRERELFAAFFEERLPQEALEGLLAQLGRQFYDSLQGAVEACDQLDALREAAECLQSEFLEPNAHAAARGGAAGAVLATVVRLLSTARECVLGVARRVLEADVRRHRPSIEDPERWRTVKHPTVDRTLAILAEAYHVLPEEQFEPLAKEGVEACVSSLSAASAVVESPMDGRLFLIRQLLVLREQLAAFEHDHGAAPRRGGAGGEAGAEAVAEAGSAEALEALRLLRLQRNGLVEASLSSACEALLDGLLLHLGRPLLLAGDAGALLARLRAQLPATVARLDAQLAQPGLAELLLRPLRAQLLALWRSRAGRPDGELETALAVATPEHCAAARAGDVVFGATAQAA